MIEVSIGLEGETMKEEGGGSRSEDNPTLVTELPGMIIRT
jgi:hypothetical protein